MMKSILSIFTITALFFIVRYFYFKPNYTTGDIAPNIEMNLNGKVTSLEDLRGNYVLVDFWGSWCPPCIKENPGLVSMYDAYHDKTFIGGGHFEIFSVGIETKEKSWKNGIEKYGLRWPYHYSDFRRFDSPVAKKYGVREIPSKFLVNPSGNIVLVNSSLEEIELFLESKLR